MNGGLENGTLGSQARVRATNDLATWEIDDIVIVSQTSECFQGILHRCEKMSDQFHYAVKH
jgi:hypothetical protein